MRCLQFILAGCSTLVTGLALAAPPEASALIDRHLKAGWEAAKVTPAPMADDAEFLRRVYLDLAGRIPSVTEARQFLDDKRPEKRRLKVDELLAGPNYANHFTEVWRALLVPESGSSLQARFQLPSFQSWLRGHLARNSGYDAMVRELITAPLGQVGARPVVGFGDSEPSPTAFFLGKELMPENLAAAASRVFLGVKLECAQCHNHPFATWKRDDFWSLAAFFAGIKRQGPGEVVIAGREDATKHEIAIPNTDRIAKARFLDGKEPAWKEGAAARQVLADWMTRPDNPYFARAAVNRMWSYFFGTGLIDPVDEMVGADVAVSFPKLLEELSKEFANSKFDLKVLIRSIVLSEAYQLSSRAPGSQDDARLFTRMPLRGLTPEQLFDSVAKAISYRNDGQELPPGVVLAGQGGGRAEFLSRFNASDKPTDHQTSILQALALMNGRLTADATSLDRSELLKGVLDAPFMKTASRIETLHLAALGRRPSEKETARLTRFIDDHVSGAKDDAEKKKRYEEAIADIFWTLLNSAEFMLNH